MGACYKDDLYKLHFEQVDLGRAVLADFPFLVEVPAVFAASFCGCGRGRPEVAPHKRREVRGLSVGGPHRRAAFGGLGDEQRGGRGGDELSICYGGADGESSVKEVEGGS